MRVDDRGRLADSIETALKLADGVVEVSNGDAETVELFSERYGCPTCGISLPELEPRHFSFNSPFGACTTCGGLGTRRRVSEQLILGAPQHLDSRGRDPAVGRAERISAEDRAARAGPSVQVRPQHPVGRSAEGRARYASCTARKLAKGARRRSDAPWEGVLANVERRYDESDSDAVRVELQEFMIEVPCSECNGQRLKPESLAVTMHGSQHRRRRGARGHRSARVLRERFRCARDGHARSRSRRSPDRFSRKCASVLRFLVDVGLDYLTLGRAAESLSGGEAQRIRLATQIGSRLVGVLYILDEPSIGLHQRDNARLLATLEQLRDLGNTVIVVEHDEETMRAANHVIDLGPGAGKHGGEVIAVGTVDEIIANPASVTGKFLSGEMSIADAGHPASARAA